MMIPAYATTEEFREYCFQSKTDTASDVLYPKVVARASRLFDLEVQVVAGFFAMAADHPSKRTFLGNGTAKLQIAAYVGTVASADAVLFGGVPLFVEVEGALVRTDGEVWAADMPVVVSARWGFAEVMEDIKEAVLELAVSIHRGKDQAFAKVAQLETGTQLFTSAMPERTKIVAAHYRRKYGEVAFNFA